MESSYDFSNSRPNPYIDQLRKEVVLKIDTDTIDYFQALEGKTGISYQNLINLYLTDCVVHQKGPKIVWQ